MVDNNAWLQSRRDVDPPNPLLWRDPCLVELNKENETRLDVVWAGKNPQSEEAKDEEEKKEEQTEKDDQKLDAQKNERKERIEAELNARSIEYFSYKDESEEAAVAAADAVAADAMEDGDLSDAMDEEAAGVPPPEEVDKEKYIATMCIAGEGKEPVFVRFTSFKEWHERFKKRQLTVLNQKGGKDFRMRLDEDLRQTLNDCCRHYDTRGTAKTDEDEAEGAPKPDMPEGDDGRSSSKGEGASNPEKTQDYVQNLENTYTVANAPDADWQGGKHYDIRHECYVLYYVPPKYKSDYHESDEHLLTIYADKGFNNIFKEKHGQVLAYLQAIYYQRRPDAPDKELPPAFYTIDQLGRYLLKGENAAAIKGVAEVALMHFLRSPHIGSIWHNNDSAEQIFKSTELARATQDEAEKKRKKISADYRDKLNEEELDARTYKLPEGWTDTEDQLWWPPLSTEEEDTIKQNRMAGIYKAQVGLDIDNVNCKKKTSLKSMKEAMQIPLKHAPPCRLPVMLMVDRSRAYANASRTTGLVPYYLNSGFHEMVSYVPYIKTYYPQWYHLVEKVAEASQNKEVVEQYLQNPLRVPWKSRDFKPTSKQFKDAKFYDDLDKKEDTLTSAKTVERQAIIKEGIQTLLDKHAAELASEHFALHGNLLSGGDHQGNIYMIRFPANFVRGAQGTGGKFKANFSYTGGGHGGGLLAKVLRKKKK